MPLISFSNYVLSVAVLQYFFVVDFQLNFCQYADSYVNLTLFVDFVAVLKYKRHFPR